MTWEDRWRATEDHPIRRGGHSTVRHVVDRNNGREGALKILTDDAQARHERRFRLREEVNALQALELLIRGVPDLYDTNAGNAGDAEELFFVMEWIPGPTLAESIAAAIWPIDEALVCTHALLDTLEVMHYLPLVHRDLKPDNIILRDGAKAEPVIIDLGLAWADNRGEEDFQTARGQEIGNRFLRLPEFAPGRAQRDPRSDVTLAAGLLLCMLCGRAPRLLNDELGRAPHVALAAEIPKAVRNDVRWPRLTRIFNVAFQTELSLRFQSVNHLRAALNQLQAPAGADDVLTPALERLRANLESEHARRRRERLARVAEIGSAFDQHVRTLFQPSGLSLPGGHGFQNGQALYYSGICLQPPGGTGGIVCCFRHEICMTDTELVARYYLEGQFDGNVTYYRGPLVDVDGLREAMWGQAGAVVAFAIDEFVRRTAG